jgi:deoxyribodipyrimidine photolyase-related protein
MSTYCKGCTYDPKLRVGETACPFTTLYWDFLDRHKEKLCKESSNEPTSIWT